MNTWSYSYKRSRVVLFVLCVHYKMGLFIPSNIQTTVKLVLQDDHVSVQVNKSELAVL